MLELIQDFGINSGFLELIRDLFDILELIQDFGIN